MKLIDLLVQELSKRGGWPEGADRCRVDNLDGDSITVSFCFPKGYSNGFDVPFQYTATISTSVRHDDTETDYCMITRGLYESALAASQKPSWNGEGLPPVGCECEVSVNGGRSWCAYRAINEKNGVRLIEIGDLTEEFQNNNWIFRQLRTEAEKKRDAFINAVLDDMRTIPCDLSLRDEVAVIYDAIAAGKIPGVKLDD